MARVVHLQPCSLDPRIAEAVARADPDLLEQQGLIGGWTVLRSPVRAS